MGYGAAGADGGQQLAEVLRHQEDVDVGRRFFQHLEERVGGFLHEGGCGDEEDPGGGFYRQALGAVDQGADLAELDEELGRIGGDDEDVGVGLDEDAGVLLVGLAHLFAGGDGFFYPCFQIRALDYAGAVAADAAEAGELAAGGVGFAGLALALQGHGQEEGEGVFACTAGAEEDERVRQAAGGDGSAEAVDCGAVAGEVIKGGGEWHGC